MLVAVQYMLLNGLLLCAPSLPVAERWPSGVLHGMFKAAQTRRQTKTCINVSASCALATALVRACIWLKEESRTGLLKSALKQLTETRCLVGVYLHAWIANSQNVNTEILKLGKGNFLQDH